MKKTTSIKLKATFLLAVFALNTVVGFACSAGLDMGFNSKHHPEENITEAFVHTHPDGKSHVHKEKKESRRHAEAHHSGEANKPHKAGNENDGCCNDKVRNVEQLDKSVPEAISIVHPVFSAAFIYLFNRVESLQPCDVSIDSRHFVRSYHPPIPDIRISIQSFQI